MVFWCLILVRVSPCWASDFFLLVQKEVTKKKDTRFRSRFPLRSNRSPVRFAAGGASGNSACGLRHPLASPASCSSARLLQRDYPF
jgi:hypothetical protein